jgi:hypothetical protein
MSLFKDNIDYCISDKTKKLLDEATKIGSKRLLDYHDAIQDTMVIEDFNMVEKSQIAQNLVHTWLTAYYSQKNGLDQLVNFRDQVKDEFMNSLDPNVKGFMKEASAEKECTQLKDIDLQIAEQQVMVKYLYDCLDIVKQLGWAIKNAIDLKKLEA